MSLRHLPPNPDDAESEFSEASEDSDDPEENQVVEDPPDEMAFLFNPVTKVAHVAARCEATDRAMCYEDSSLQTFRTGCGARPNAVSGDLCFLHCLPDGARLCLRSACARFMSKSA